VSLCSATYAALAIDATLLQVSLMLALSEVSSRTLAAAAQQGLQAMPVGTAAGSLAAAGTASAAAAGSGAAAGGFRLSALNRMVEVLLYNLPRIQVRLLSTSCLG
jgi:hypothetical protein